LRVLVNGVSVDMLSARHVLFGHLRQLARWTEQSHQFVVLTAPNETQPLELRRPNIVWQTTSNWTRHWTTRRVWESTVLPGLIREQKIDLYCTPNGMIHHGLPVPQISLAANPWPLVPSIHQTWSERFKARLQRAAFFRAFVTADLMVFISRHLQELFQQYADVPPSRRHIIAHPGINDQTHEHGLKAGVAGKHALTILSVSAMAPWKGADVVVRALEQVRRHIPALLRIVGPWPDAAYERLVRDEIRTRGLTGAVTITGRVSGDQLLREYAEAKVFCLMSRCESFGIPAVEAQAHGVPIVGSSTCAMPEICGDGGVFHDPNDVDAVASSLRQLLTDAATWQRFSDAARANADKYRWEVCSRPLLEMFSLDATTK
jgi:glycosyltransferase involved in cell wall biosynthesis